MQAGLMKKIVTCIILACCSMPTLSFGAEEEAPSGGDAVNDGAVKTSSLKETVYQFGKDAQGNTIIEYVLLGNSDSYKTKILSSIPHTFNIEQQFDATNRGLSRLLRVPRGGQYAFDEITINAIAKGAEGSPQGLAINLIKNESNTPGDDANIYTELTGNKLAISIQDSLKTATSGVIGIALGRLGENKFNIKDIAISVINNENVDKYKQIIGIHTGRPNALETEKKDIFIGDKTGDFIVSAEIANKNSAEESYSYAMKIHKNLNISGYNNLNLKASGYDAYAFAQGFEQSKAEISISDITNAVFEAKGLHDAAGIEILDAGDVSIAADTINIYAESDRSADGIFVDKKSEITLQGNTIVQSKGAESWAMRAYNGSKISINGDSKHATYIDGNIDV
jgi:hypothetical protein